MAHQNTEVAREAAKAYGDACRQNSMDLSGKSVQTAMGTISALLAEDAYPTSLDMVLIELRIKKHPYLGYIWSDEDWD